MRFVVDADLPPAAVTLLQSAGHECTYVPDLFPPRTPDPIVAAYARETERCIVTRDFGFSDMRQYVPREHHGIIVLTVPPEGGTRYISDLLREVLERLPEVEPLRGKLLIVEPGRIRIRQ